MAEEQEQIELELDETEDTEVEVKEALNEDSKPEIEVSEDQFDKRHRYSKKN